jgi:hypothetical protein
MPRQFINSCQKCVPCSKYFSRSKTKLPCALVLGFKINYLSEEPYVQEYNDNEFKECRIHYVTQVAYGTSFRTVFVPISRKSFELFIPHCICI